MVYRMLPLSLVALLLLTASAASGQEAQVIAEGRQPQAAVDAGGTVWLVYGQDRTIWLKSSADAGKSFGEAQRVAEVPAMDLGMRRGPRIAAVDGALVVTAIAGEQARGRDGDVLMWRTTDGGKTWSEPKTLNSAKGSAREGLQATAAAGRHIAVVWLDLRAKGTTLYGTFSSDGGATFSVDRVLYESPSGTICECCAPQAAVDEQGRVAVMFRNFLDGNRDMYLMTSSDGGASFTAARKQGQGSWKLDACPMDGGAVAIVDDALVMLWRRENQLYTTHDSFEAAADGPQQEQKVDSGENASLAGGSRETQAAFVGAGGSIMYSGSLLAPAQVAAPAGEDPVIVSPGKGRPPLLFWEHDGKIMVRAAPWK